MGSFTLWRAEFLIAMLYGGFVLAYILALIDTSYVHIFCDVENGEVVLYRQLISNRTAENRVRFSADGFSHNSAAHAFYGFREECEATPYAGGFWRPILS